MSEPIRYEDDYDASPASMDDLDEKAVAYARSVPSAPLEPYEQIIYDKIKSSALKGKRLNPDTGEMEPMEVRWTPLSRQLFASVKVDCLSAFSG